MTRPSICCLVLLMATSAACSQAQKAPAVKALASYSETPAFIKTYIASAFRDSFKIAEKGEKWNGGCVVDLGKPCYKFVSATLEKDRYRLDYLSGGFVLTQRTLLVRFRGDEVVSHSLK